MIGRGLLLLTILSSCVLSLPVTSGQLENEDVEVMKCIVEALADVLSRPHLVPISQACLVTLKTDDRLVSILRHHNFLKELQEVAVQGGQERATLQRPIDTPTPTTQALHSADNADRSMLEALGGPGERSILSERKRTRNGGGSEEKGESREDGESQEDSESEEGQVKREKDEDQGEAEMREEDEEEYNKRQAHSEGNSEEENETKDKKGDGSDEERDASRNKSNQKKSDEEEEEENNKRSALFSQKHEGHEEEEEEYEEGMKRGSRDGLKRWAKRAKALQLKKKAAGKEVEQLSSSHEVPHHSKEVIEEEEKEEKKKRVAQRSPEETELQMIARRAPEERRGIEEEGSASRKSEEPEIESLAAIESELENVAQKLHELRRG
ncbi:chromogranin-A [Odontesthes bonariensis]|uniref:chromogranin-A n=1 Tax=Odontesthes bonariensis TaxID=219752 RepID=UPI003F58C965